MTEIENFNTGIKKEGSTEVINLNPKINIANKKKIRKENMKPYKMLQIPVTKGEYDKIEELAKKENRSIPAQIKVLLKTLFNLYFVTKAIITH